MDSGILREALRHYALAPASRALDRPPDIAAALRWLEKASLPVSMVSKPQHARATADPGRVRYGAAGRRALGRQWADLRCKQIAGQDGLSAVTIHERPYCPPTT